MCFRAAILLKGCHFEATKPGLAGTYPFSYPKMLLSLTAESAVTTSEAVRVAMFTIVYRCLSTLQVILSAEDDRIAVTVCR